MAQARTALDLLASDEARTIRAVGRAALEKRSASSESYLDRPSMRLIDALGGTASASGARVSETSASTVPMFNACVGILSDMIGMLPCKLHLKTDGGSIIAKDHPAHRCLAVAPGDLQTPFELRQQTQDGVGYGGNGYIRVWRDSYYQPGELQWIPPNEVNAEIIVRPDGRKFARFNLKGVREPLTRADIIHVHTRTVDGLVGISPVRQLRESIGLSITQRLQASKIYANGARFPGFVVTPTTLRKEQIDDFRTEWAAKQEGTENAGKTPILWGGYDYKAVNGMSMADAEFLESRKFERTEISTLFRIPEVIMGNSDKASSWGTGIETLTNGFLQFCLNPWLVNWEQSLNYTLLSMEEQANGYYFEFNRRALLSVALETQAKFLREMRDIGVYSRNDARGFLGENHLSIEQGGDDYDRPFNGSGGTASADPAQKPQPANAA